MNSNIHFVGREKELRQLKSLLEETKKGLGKLVFISGEPGGGKSSLVRQFISQHEQNCLTAIHECVDKEWINEYIPFKRILIELNADALSATTSEKKDFLKKIKSVVSELGPDWISFIPVFGSVASAVIKTTQAVGKHFFEEKQKSKNCRT